DLYGKGEDYTTQLRALEKTAREKPEEPALRFLLGYHYGFLGYPAEAVKQLQKCVSLAPQDETALKTLRMFEDKLPKKDELPTPGPPPTKNTPAPSAFFPPPPLKTEPSKDGLNTAKPATANTETASADAAANSAP